MKLEVVAHELPPIGTQCYAVINPASGQIAVFDAPLNAYATVERLAVRSGYQLSGLYFTHGHWDHMLDGHAFAAAGIRVHAHAADRMFFTDPSVMASYSIPGLPMPPVAVDEWVEDGQLLQIAGEEVEVRAVPGHSPGSVLYWFRQRGFAISGDALFRGSVGRTDFPGCSFAALEQSILGRIYTLPDNTVIYPGHGPATSVGEEARSNPFVRRSGA